MQEKKKTPPSMTTRPLQQWINPPLSKQLKHDKFAQDKTTISPEVPLNDVDARMFCTLRFQDT
jgi:hypothetical protein